MKRHVIISTHNNMHLVISEFIKQAHGKVSRTLNPACKVEVELLDNKMEHRGLEEELKSSIIVGAQCHGQLTHSVSPK